MSKIIYDLGNGKVKQLSNSSFDSNTNTLSVQGVSSSTVTLNLPDGIIFSDNKILSSSVGSDGQIISWDNTNSRWAFRDFQKLPTVSTAIPAGSDVTGSYLTNAQVKSLSNVVSGTLPVVRGGTGLTTADLSAVTYDALLVADGSNKLTYKLASEDISKPYAVAQFTGSSNFDETANANKIALVDGQIGDASTSIFGNTKALSSSYDTSAANYTGYISLSDQHAGDFTLEFWTYLINVGNSISGTDRSVIYVDGAFNSGITISGSAAGTSVGSYTIFNGTSITNVATFIPNQWVHLCMTRQNNKLKLYVNATGSSEISCTTNNNFNSIYIGTNSNGTYNINGYMTDFCFSKYAKTAAEITSYYNLYLAGNQTRHSKDEQNLNATNRIQSSLMLDSTNQKINTVYGYGAGILTSTGIFNYYY